ncbi:MAG: FGGY family carbohydrate kinase [Lentisphaeria bacterium]|jgi:xylulokinase|nr:carbohydrate kinase [Lentisphaeria bacterium]MDD6338254.1 FGGY family carbohydrate kinase [Lentisphaeria bacterium]
MSYYLGLDSSTQGLKAEVIDTVAGKVVGSFAVNFKNDLPEYQSPSGYLPNDDELVRQADPRMWVAAMDMLFDRMKKADFPMEKIAGISGSGQQHGSVYLSAPITDWDPAKKLADQLPAILSRPVAPIWMDKSTGLECAWLTEKFGNRMRTDSGSPAIERFTGPQIRKFAVNEPEAWAKTKTVHLVSSFLCSVLCGRDCAIDYGDGAGMNLLNLHKLVWDPEFVAATAPDLMSKLPPVKPSQTIAGKLSAYFTQYGLKAGIPVVVWSGDNPCSLIGVGGGSVGTAVISLGTSDTFFATMEEFVTDPDGCGHVFGNPAGGFMSLICFTNGSFAREHLRDELGVDWHFFDVTACAETKPGNGGRLMLPYYEAENTPAVPAGVVRNFDPATASKAEQIRCLLESQALTMRRHSAWQGGGIFKRIRVTGGASKSATFRQILADVFQAKIETVSIANSASLGAAIRAANGIEGTPFDDLYAQFCSAASVIEPNPANRGLYDSMLTDYASLEYSRG